jgi:sporulation protein YlmC with PRC-barrel domain
MAKHLFYSMIVAATALTSLPTLAQTAPGTAARPPSAAASSAVTSPAPVPPANTTATASATADSASSSTTYFTSDHLLRTSKLVGASVYDDQDKSIGSISDILLGNNDHAAGTVVLSVGGFLGIASKLVSVPFSQLKIQDNKVIMPGATKSSLESMPDYKYHDKV